VTEPLHNFYRPRTWAEVIGQDAAVKSLSGLVKRREAQTFLLSGPAGTGKTTLARISAKTLDCDPQNIIEIDAATNTGIDAMREIKNVLHYRPFGNRTGRAIIVDECHRLSAQAWDSVLKDTEEPPPHVSWFFCTTNAAKVPATIKTRCAHIQLKAVSDKDLGRIYDDVCKEENIDLPGDIGDLIIREAKGSPRQMLQNLALCRDITNRKEAAEALKTAVESDPVIELCRFLAGGGKGAWTKVMAIVDKLPDEPEGVRIVVMNYFGSAIIKAKNDREAATFLNVLDCFAQSYNSAEGKAPLLLSIGRVLLAA
jgi:DNA polymerase-3 subunit gamma/tau